MNLYACACCVKFEKKSSRGTKLHTQSSRHDHHLRSPPPHTLHTGAVTGARSLAPAPARSRRLSVAPPLAPPQLARVPLAASQPLLVSPVPRRCGTARLARLASEPHLASPIGGAALPLALLTQLAAAPPSPHGSAARRRSCCRQSDCARARRQRRVAAAGARHTTPAWLHPRRLRPTRSYVGLRRHMPERPSAA